MTARPGSFTRAVTTIRGYEPHPHELSSLDTVTRLLNVPRRRVLVYCRHGFISPVTDPNWDELLFDAGAIRLLRQIESLRFEWGMSLRQIERFLEMTDEIARLRAELDFYR